MDYYLIQGQRIDRDALFSTDPNGCYWYEGGWNPAALKAVIPATLAALATSFAPAAGDLKNFSLFIGAGLAAALYAVLSRPSRS